MNEHQIIERYDEIVQHDSNYRIMLDEIASRARRKVLEVGEYMNRIRGIEGVRIYQ